MGWLYRYTYYNPRPDLLICVRRPLKAEQRYFALGYHPA